MSDESKLIGLGRCPVCEQPKARYTLTKSQLVCVTCRQFRCGFQGFSRTEDCDESLRALIAAPSPEAAIPAAPAPAPAPAASPKTPSVDPMPDADVLPPAPPAKKGMSWGALRG